MNFRAVQKGQGRPLSSVVSANQQRTGAVDTAWARAFSLLSAHSKLMGLLACYRPNLLALHLVVLVEYVQKIIFFIIFVCRPVL